MNALTKIEAAPSANVEAYRASTDAAAICKEIVVATASTIQGRKYVAVEGWQAIAIAHGCAASALDVEQIKGGVRARGEVRRMSDGVLISTAEGFVGEDEPTWYGGDNGRGRTLPRRPDYAIRAMAQTRAISRACRSAFAHVVVMMNAGLATTPAEEVPSEGFDDRQPVVAKPIEPAPSAFISEAQRGEITDLATAKNIEAKTLCEVGGISSVREMPVSMFAQCKAWIAKQPARTIPPANQQPIADILDDEVPY